ncbi:MAG TPA: sugar ABC transporter permease [Candidatus Fraserbacteria bacterium]|nr:sugar ABC transporter permease [Candidatus Fraserbacteria bacterium]
MHSLYRQREEIGAAAVLLLPLLWTLAVAFLYAFIRAVYFSFTNYDLFNITKFMGLENYLRLFQDYRFILALWHTLFYAAGVTAFQTVGALMLAVLLNRKLRGLTFFRASYYVPSIASSVVITLIFIWLMHRSGMVNYLLTMIVTYPRQLLAWIGITLLLQLGAVLWERSKNLPARWLDPLLLLLSSGGAALIVFLLDRLGLLLPTTIAPLVIPWLTTTNTVLGIPLPLLSIMMLNIWTTAPTMMLLFLAGLQDVPQPLYEAAELDGATPWQKLFFITIPALRPVSFLVITLGLIGTLQMFDQVAITTGVAPLDSVITLAYYVYWNIFGISGHLPRVGMAAAAALVLALLTLAIVLLQRRFLVSEKGWGE